MKTICFRTDRFQPYLPDDCQVNPNVLGFELAHWLSVELMKAGIVTSYPHSEDWGWFLDYSISEREYLICCGGYEDEEADGLGGTTRFYEWKIFVERAKGLFQRLKTNSDEVNRLMTRIAECLAGAGISFEIEEANAE